MPATDGIVTFTLTTTANGDSMRVEAPVSAGMTATQKALAVRDAVAQDATWQAVASGSVLSFQHLVGESWIDVDSITNLADTSGGGTQIETRGTIVDFNLDIDPYAVASGVDALGEPSFITVTLTDTLAWTRAIQPGETPDLLVDRLQAFLAQQAGEGVQVSRQGPTSLSIRLDYQVSALSWQVTDTGLQLLATGGGQQLWDGTAGLIDR